MSNGTTSSFIDLVVRNDLAGIRDKCEQIAAQKIIENVNVRKVGIINKLNVGK